MDYKSSNNVWHLIAKTITTQQHSATLRRYTQALNICLWSTNLLCVDRPDLLPISQYICLYFRPSSSRWVGRVGYSVQHLATGWTVRGSNPDGGEIFCTCPDRPWCPPSLLYNGYRVFPGGKERPGRDADPSPPSNAVGHERVELYLYSLYGPYGLYRASVPVQGWPLPLPLAYDPLPLFKSPEKYN